MKLTKYQHACFTLEKDGEMLVVDPGVYTYDLPVLEHVVAIVITHEHPDHFDKNALSAIIAHNPGAIIYAHRDIAQQLDDTLPHHTVQAGETVRVGTFSMEFFGGQHATIHESLPSVANLGVMINDSVYYPGDSLTEPHRPVRVLALPATAPWLAIGKSLDLLAAVQPDYAFPTHDAIASDTGKQLVDTMIGNYAKSIGVRYARVTEPIEIEG